MKDVNSRETEYEIYGNTESSLHFFYKSKTILKQNM